MTRLFQITEEDLGELERMLPQFSDALMEVMTGRLRTKLRRCQKIISDVRWNYGPAEVAEFPDELDSNPESEPPQQV